MHSNGINNWKSAPDSAKPTLNSSKSALKSAAVTGPAGAPQSRATVGTSAADATVLSAHSESLYLKLTNSDGDVLEIKAESSEVAYSGGSAGHGATPVPARQAADGGPDLADGAPAGKDVSAAEDPKAKQLADLRAWAKQVERELRQQQHKLVEQALKQSAQHVDSGDGKFLLVYTSMTGKSADGSDAAQSDEEANVPPYWNAENTSDRIVHFATQMAEISGLDLGEFAAKIKDAIGAGFDQAKQATGELPGAAGKLNKDTKDLVFAKLSKWLEAKQSVAYNEKARSNAISTVEVPDGTENNQQ
jgi:hypothetical protein